MTTQGTTEQEPHRQGRCQRPESTVEELPFHQACTPRFHPGHPVWFYALSGEIPGHRTRRKH